MGTSNKIVRSKKAHYSPQEIETILFPKMPIHTSEVALVFGKGLMTAFLAQRAAHLVEAGVVEKILVMGGVASALSKDTPGYLELGVDQTLADNNLPPYHDNETEAEWARRILQNSNVPDSAILFENKSTNTGMNVTEAIKEHGLDHMKSAIIIAEAGHSRRLIETVRNFIPLKKDQDALALTIDPVFIPGFSRENWMHNDALVENFITPELQRLGFTPWDQDDYIKQGFITPASIKNETQHYQNVAHKDLQPQNRPPSLQKRNAMRRP